MTNTETPVRKRRRLRPVEVHSIEKLTPRMISITFGGELDGFEIAAPTQHIKIVIPPPGQHRVELPNLDGGDQNPAPRPPMRTYTPRRFDPETGQLEVQFVIHGAGLASTWAERAEVGDQLAIGGPGGRMPLELRGGSWVIAGDESAIPAIGTLLEFLPPDASPAVYIESDTAQRELPFPEGATNIHWIQSVPDAPGRRLHDALASAPFEQTSNVWVACEATAVRRIRHTLLEGDRVGPSNLVTRGYWRAGHTDHPDHDYGDDG